MIINYYNHVRKCAIPFIAGKMKSIWLKLLFELTSSFSFQNSLEHLHTKNFIPDLLRFEYFQNSGALPSWALSK